MSVPPDSPAGPDKPTPFFLTPPGSGPPPSRNNTLLLVLIGIGLTLLIALAVAVMFYMPAKRPAPVPVGIEHAPVSNTTATTPEPGRAEADHLQAEWLRQKAAAEAENIGAWAPEKYARLQHRAEETYAFLAAGRYVEAQSGFTKQLGDLATILDEKETILTRSLDEGWQALIDEDSTAALAAFSLALAIDPDHAVAARGKARAENLDRVVVLYRQGLDLEKKAEHNDALRVFREVSALDGEYAPAVEAQARVEEVLRQGQYREAMGRALTLLDQRNAVGAAAAIEEAARLKTGDPALADATVRLTMLQQELKLEWIQARADQAAGAEQWGEAVALYSQALAIDEQASFAALGLQEARQREQLDKMIRDILASPGRLQENGPLQEARHVLDRASDIADPGPLLNRQITQLEQVITDASTQVPVLLESNGLTAVEIYHVGRFRPFSQQRLVLRPGNYTVVGRRSGFKDVRLTMTITAEQADKLPVFIIRCEEPI